MMHIAVLLASLIALARPSGDDPSHLRPADQRAFELTPCPCKYVGKPDHKEPHCLIHHLPGGHLRTSAGARIAVTESGLLHIVEPCGDLDQGPDVLWYLLALPAKANNCPPANPTAPYNPITNTPNPDNPYVFVPSYQVPDNITRRWPSSGNQYTIWIPPAPGGLGTNIFPPVPPPGSAIPYTYSQFAQDVTAIMSHYLSLPWVDLSFNQIIVPPPSPNYDAPGPGPTNLNPPLSPGQLVWDVCHPAPGPTGNGLNEFIFLTYLIVGGAGGLTSMLVDPASGMIQECDVIFQAQAANSWGPGGPRFNTGLFHEIGHFLGLDHTNLHPGVNGFFANIQPVPAVPYPSTAFLYDNGFVPDQLPGMVSVFTPTAMNYVTTYTGTTALVNSMYGDDVAGLAQLYPVAQATAAGKRHLSWDTATIMGQVTTSAGVPVFGANLLVAQHVFQSSAPPIAPSGPCFPVNGKISGTSRNGPLSVVGAQNLATGAQTTGEFRVVGIHTTAIALPPRQLDVISEPIESIGITSTNGALGGEWVFDQVLNPTANLWPPPPTTGVASCGFISNDSILRLGSLSVVPGTVIKLPPLKHGTGYQLDNVSRPLVEIVRPATAYPPPGPGALITVNVHHNYNVPLTVGALINQAIVAAIASAGPVGPSPLGAFFMSPYNVTVPPNAGPGFELVVTAQERSSPAGQPRCVQGIGQLRF